MVQVVKNHFEQQGSQQTSKKTIKTTTKEMLGAKFETLKSHRIDSSRIRKKSFVDCVMQKNSQKPRLEKRNR